MTTIEDPDALRARARQLRLLAASLDRSTLRRLGALGGDDTWRWPTADAFAESVRMAVARLDQAIDELWLGARWLERQADEAAPLMGC